MTATTVGNAVARRREDRTAIDFMWSKKSHLATVLPRSVDVEAFLGTAAGALYSNKTLMEYAIGNVDSLFVALMECATLGHLPGTEEYYLMPRRDKGRGKVLGIEGYRGVIERMYRSGAVNAVHVREVCANDYFRYTEGVDARPVHRFGGEGETGAGFFGAMGKRGEMVGGYAYADLVTGAVSRVVLLSRDDVFAARDSGGYKPDDAYSPWNKLDGGPAHPEYKGRSMWLKTFAHRLEPWVPTSAEYRRESLRASAAAVEHARRPELPPARTVDTGTGEVVDAEIVDEQDPSPAGTETPGSAPPAPSPSGEPPAGEAPARPATEGQVTTLRMHVERLGYAGNRDGRLRATARLANLEPGTLSTTSDLTREQAALAIRRVKDLREATDLAALLDDLTGDPRDEAGE